MSRSTTIIIEFDEDLIGDVTGNQGAFTVTSKRHEHINGKLIDSVHIVTGTNRIGQNKLQLTINPFTRFNNAKGELRVKYEQNLGTLMGEGGSVESFDEHFVPTGLEPIPNPYIEEFITVLSHPIIEYKQISYTSFYSTEEFISAVTSDIKVDFIRVSNNPL